MTKPIPTAVHCSSFVVAGRSIRVYVLNDGRRVVHADDMNALVAYLNAGHATLTSDEAADLRDRLQGGSA